MKKFNIIIILIFILSLVVRIGLLSQKDDLFYDEILNMTAANHNELYSNRSNYFEKNKIYNGYEVKQKFLLNDASIKDATNDIKNLHKYSGDVLHTNLYYSITRIMFLGADKYSLNDYLIRIGGLNLILFSLAFFIMYKLLNILFKDKKYVALGLILAFLNPASISNTLFLREYQLQELMVILISYLGVFHWNNKINLKNILPISTILALALLSGYYIGYFVFCFFVMLLAKKDFKNFTILAICTISILLLIYPQFFGFFISKVAQNYSHDASLSLGMTETQVKEKSTPLLLGFIKYPVAVYHFICSYILMFYFIIIGIKAPKINENKVPIFILTILSLIWVIIVLTTCPFRITRYMLPAIPICSIILTYILACTKSKKSVVIVLCLLFLHTSIVGFNTFFKIKHLQYTNLKLKNKQHLIIEENKNLPVYIISNNYETFAAIVTHIDDNQEVKFVENKSEIPDKHYYMCTDDTKTPLIFKPETMLKDQDTGIFYFCFEFLE